MRGLAFDLVGSARTADSFVSLTVSGTDHFDRSADMTANLAGALAATHRDVAIIDASPSEDLYRAQRSSFAMPLVPTDALIDQAWLRSAGVHPLASSTLALYRLRPGAALRDTDVKDALEAMSDFYGVVLVYVEPAFGSLTAAPWIRACDASVLIATNGATYTASLQRSAATLRRASSDFIGIVFDERTQLARWLRRLARRPRRRTTGGEEGMLAGASSLKRLQAGKKSSQGLIRGERKSDERGGKKSAGDESDDDAVAIEAAGSKT